MDFEVVNKRGINKEVVVRPEVDKRLESVVEESNAGGDIEPQKAQGEVIEFKKTVRGEVQGWKEPITYLLIQMPIGQGVIFMCRAVGMRTDEKVFTADYAISPRWDEGENFTVEAKNRLNTFLACSCDKHGQCRFHSESLPGKDGPGKWLEADINRLKKVQREPLPEAVEVLMKAEALKAQSRIVVPGR